MKKVTKDTSEKELVSDGIKFRKSDQKSKETAKKLQKVRKA